MCDMISTAPHTAVYLNPSSSLCTVPYFDKLPVLPDVSQLTIVIIMVKSVAMTPAPQSGPHMSTLARPLCTLQVIV